MAAADNNAIFVIGACNTDLITYAERHPLPGETLRGDKFVTGFGGKGANQAVQAAALLGSNSQTSVFMLGKVGTDAFGEKTLENFAKRGVSTKYVHTTSEASSGVAPIVVSASGQNSILIVGGANDLLTVEEVRSASDDILGADWLLAQLEIPLPITLEAFKIAKSRPDARVRTILNTAPAMAPPLSPDFLELLRLADIICPNEVELAQLTASTVREEHFIEDVESAAAKLLELCLPSTPTIISTVGSRGCVISSGSPVQHTHVQPPLQITADRVIDTSGAGDSFLGAFAVALLEFSASDLTRCAREAQYASGLSVCRRGTQSSYPSREVIDRLRSGQCDLSAALD